MSQEKPHGADQKIETMEGAHEGEEQDVVVCKVAVHHKRVCDCISGDEGKKNEVEDVENGGGFHFFFFWIFFIFRKNYWILFRVTFEERFLIAQK